MAGAVPEPPEAERLFAEHRGLLQAVAYRVLGSVADAEDVVQDTWLRWSRVDTTGINDAEAYLVRVAIRLAIDQLRSARVRRESYVGPWLPEPMLTSPDIADQVALVDSVSTAMLLVLEALSPLERAVFVLREAFGYNYADCRVRRTQRGGGAAGRSPCPGIGRGTPAPLRQRSGDPATGHGAVLGRCPRWEPRRLDGGAGTGGDADQ